MTPRSGRYKAGGLSAGPGPARYLVMREWRRNTDYHFRTERGAKAPPRGRTARDLSAGDGQGRVHRAGAPPPAARPQHRLPRRLDHRMHVCGPRQSLSASCRAQARAGARAQGQRHQRRPVGQQQHAFAAAAAGQGRPPAAGLRRAHAWDQRYRRADHGEDLLEHERIAAPLRGGADLRGRCRQGPRQVRSFPTRRSSCSAAPRRCASSSASGAPRRKRRSRPRAPDRRAEMGRDFESSLRSFVRVATAWGITPVLMTQVYVEPTSATERSGAFVNREQLAGAGLRPDEHPTLLDYFNAITREVARSEADPADRPGARARLALRRRLRRRAFHRRGLQAGGRDRRRGAEGADRTEAEGARGWRKNSIAADGANAGALPNQSANRRSTAQGMLVTPPSAGAASRRGS